MVEHHLLQCNPDGITRTCRGKSRLGSRSDVVSKKEVGVPYFVEL